MIPNNNLSVLPWYTSIEQQNARKWWVYGRVYPLFTPAMFMLPFQIMREHRESLQRMPFDPTIHPFYISGTPSVWTDTNPDIGCVLFDVSQFQGKQIRFKKGSHGIDYTFLKSIDDIGDRVQYATGYTQEVSVNTDVTLTIPNDATFAYFLSQWEPEEIDVMTPTRVQSFNIYDKNGEPLGDYTPNITPYLSIKPIGAIDVIVFPGNFPIFTAFANGQYYARISDGTQTWYSEIFTVVNDIEPYLKIEWWDTEDFIMDAGAIVYKNPAFHNVLYLDSDLAKPEYPFEEEGETRDGYFFPIKQISEKHYRFKFFASEYLLDVMRFIRMADYARITYHGQTYELDTFLITPEWEDNGDVASVEAEFDTATVAKKIGRGYVVPTAGGNFNDDFNNDFNN